MATLAIDHGKISDLGKRIAQARAVYGTDSAYVIGLFTALDWILEDVENGEDTGRFLRDSVLELEQSGKLKPISSDIPVEAAQVRPPGAAHGSLVEDTWMKGAVKWFNNDKGYGFISTDNNVDVFVHWRDISSWDHSLSQGDVVEFMVTKTAKGFQAINVVKVDEAAGGKAPGVAVDRSMADERVAGSDSPSQEELQGDDQDNSIVASEDVNFDAVDSGQAAAAGPEAR